MADNRPPPGSEQGAPFYRPYRQDGPNFIYNLLFCDNPDLFRTEQSKNSAGAVSVILSDGVDRETLERLGNDLDTESRARVLAFNRLRAMKLSVPQKRLLGTIIEFPQEAGLDVLAAFPDTRLRYINQSEKMIIIEPPPPAAIAEKSEELLRASQLIVNRIGPWDKPRLPPPTGDRVRMSFLVSDGLYFGEGSFADLMRDRLAEPAMNAASALVDALISTALETKNAAE
jgi:hypothetical protein